MVHVTVRAVTTVALVVLGLVAVTGPASAQQLGQGADTPETSREANRLDVDLKIGLDGFRLGARLFGLEGVWGAWVNGNIRSNGITVDGRIQEPGKPPHNFTLNAEIAEELLRAARKFQGF